MEPLTFVTGPVDMVKLMSTSDINSLVGYFPVAATQNSGCVDDSKGKRKKRLVGRNKLMGLENLLEQGICFCCCFLCLNPLLIQ